MIAAISAFVWIVADERFAGGNGRVAEFRLLLLDQSAVVAIFHPGCRGVGTLLLLVLILRHGVFVSLVDVILQRCFVDGWDSRRFSRRSSRIAATAVGRQRERMLVGDGRGGGWR